MGLKNNEKYTGASVGDEGIDSGDIIIQRKIEIKNKTQQECEISKKMVWNDC